MAKAGDCMFKIGYFFYTRTRIGYWYHQRDVAKAKEELAGSCHTETETSTYEGLSVLPVAMVKDNYAYIISADASSVIIIDPGEPEPVIAALERLNLTPTAMLITHKHWDHSGGNEAMKRQYPGLRVYGGSEDRVPGATHSVGDDETLEFGRLRFRTILAPGHTTGHTLYLLDGGEFHCPDFLFSGDHLFLGGCGRMFEGSPMTMLRSLDRVAALKEDLLIWPGHEYASDNLEFACFLDPSNEDAKTKYDWVKDRRSKKLSTSPSTLKEELSYNPFLRTMQEGLLRSMGLIEGDGFTVPNDDTRARVLSEIRQRKDDFKYKM